MYVNEIQRTINGLGRAYSMTGRVIPYGYFMPYRPGAIARQPGFGDIPNDFEASVDLQYIPVRQGWYYGYPVNGSGYPDARRSFGRASDPEEGGQVAVARLARKGGQTVRRRAFGDANSDAAIAQLAKTETLQTVLQVVSTLSIASMATLAIVRAIRARRNPHMFLGDED